MLGRYTHHFFSSAKTAFLGPQVLAFLPALMLAGYWFGGEAALLVMAIVMPALLGLVGLFTPVKPKPEPIGPVDPITHLPMRDALESALDRAFAYEGASGLRSGTLALELDDFEQFYNQQGVDAADRVLTQVATRIKNTVRELDLVSRQDDATFLIALAPARRADLESMVQISARLQAALEEPVEIDGMRLFLTACIGFCVPRRASEKNGAFCLEAAEIALADAQANGAGAIRAYAAQPKRKRLLRTGLVAEVSGALETGQIKPWFQPQLSTDTGLVSGVEALARWDHPERGIILPGAFLPAISAAGANDRLSEVILFHSLSALRDWDAAGLDVPSVGVNFSSDDLSNPKLCDRIRWELDRFDLAPERLTIEILETVIARSANDIITRNISDLANLGCGIDLDDFGTGHASIANIRRFAVKRIKIDRSFVTNVDRDRQQQQMLTAILEMASRLEITTLAEGVETAGEHTLLAQLGCVHVQGYHIGKPMTVDETFDWLANHKQSAPSQAEFTKKTGT